VTYKHLMTFVVDRVTWGGCSNYIIAASDAHTNNAPCNVLFPWRQGIESWRRELVVICGHDKTANSVLNFRPHNYKIHFTSLEISPSICLCVILRRSVTSIPPFIFPSITSFRKHFLHRMWRIQSAFIFITIRTILLFPLTLCNTSSFLTRSVQLICSILLQHISKLSRHSGSTFKVSRFQHQVELIVIIK
jgi:hypothetical protein